MSETIQKPLERSKPPKNDILDILDFPRAFEEKVDDLIYSLSQHSQNKDVGSAVVIAANLKKLIMLTYDEEISMRKFNQLKELILKI